MNRFSIGVYIMSNNIKIIFIFAFFRVFKFLKIQSQRFLNINPEFVA
ncbi:hypothetical protein OMAG_002096 [Candidatus Omnitrophus magneticus]|uniref:Uncharacterized protein n=1 Tax=Candidatus Omnitrophus magneticus TaxID=1609969 RepID=A0A0F0CLA4_9BACT|nr:hypothetical protein OMAG_002096 [Candidatus Omnitrophus magneticus]